MEKNIGKNNDRELVYLTSSKEYSPTFSRLQDHFDKSSRIYVDSNPETLHEKWKEFDNCVGWFNNNEFLISDPSLKRLSSQIARKMLNYGVLEKSTEKIMIGDKIVTPETKIGGVDINLSHACNFPYSGEQRILCVGPHYEEESTLFPAYLHKKQGDKIFNLVVTEIPKDGDRPNLEKLTRNVYEKTYGFEGEGKDYAFMNLEDRYVYGNKKEFMNYLEKTIGSFNPTTIITTPSGANFDHQAVGEFIWEMVENTDINYLFGNVLQNTTFKSNIWSVVDGNERKKLVDTFQEYPGGIGSDPGHKYSIDNLFEVGTCEPINRRFSFLAGDKKIPENDKTAVYGLQAVKFTHPNGYRIPHSTKFFDI